MASALPREAAERFLSARRGDLECDAPVCFARRWVLKQPTHESAFHKSGFIPRFNLLSKDISTFQNRKKINPDLQKWGMASALPGEAAERFLSARRGDLECDAPSASLGGGC